MALTPKNDNEEEDVGCYFLQPASSPYNLAEKVEKANRDLLDATPEASRSTKVKFRDELVSFEPDMTDDDVNSIESDQFAEELPFDGREKDYLRQCDDEEEALSYNTVLRGGTGIYNIEEEEEDIDEAIFEELVESEDSTQSAEKESIILSSPETASQKPPESSGELVQDLRDKKKERPIKKHLKTEEIDCKKHCIERIDCSLSMDIKRLAIREKPPSNLPPLQLHQRKCCDDFKLAQNDRNLPNYKGYRSEYGLSCRQIKNRSKYLETVKRKELARQRLIEEYRALRTQQNEQVFCQWLKEVSRRQQQKDTGKRRQSGTNSGKESSEDPVTGATIVDLNKETRKIRERPHTVGFLPKRSVKKCAGKKRPHTSDSSCVYIQLSNDALKKGVHVGDLLITNAKELSKKLHILTVS